MKNNKQLKAKSHYAARAAISLACLGSLASTLPALAQGAAEFEGADLHTPYNGTRISPGFGYRAKADIDGGGEFGETAFSVRGGPSFSFSDNLRLVTVGTYRFSHYDWSDVGTDPWEDIHNFRLTSVVAYGMNDQWSIYGGPTAGFAFEDGADISHSFTMGALGGVNYKVNDTLSLGGGLGFSSQIEDDARFFPFITANWQFADQWNFRIGFSEVAASGGLGAEVSYELNSQWKLGAGFQFQQKRFLLDDNGPVPDGVGQDKSVPIYAKAAWKINDAASIEFLVGVAAGGEVLIEDADENEIAEEDYDPSALVGLRAVFSF